ILTNAVPGNFRNASYDHRIARILALTCEEVEEYILPSQGMAEVLSAKRVALREDVAGYALVRMTLCNQGILAINIRIIDPGYAGLISSTLINFRKNQFVLHSPEMGSGARSAPRAATGSRSTSCQRTRPTRATQGGRHCWCNVCHRAAYRK